MHLRDNIIISRLFSFPLISNNVLFHIPSRPRRRLPPSRLASPQQSRPSNRRRRSTSSTRPIPSPTLCTHPPNPMLTRTTTGSSRPHPKPPQRRRPHNSRLSLLRPKRRSNPPNLHAPQANNLPRPHVRGIRPRHLPAPLARPMRNRRPCSFECSVQRMPLPQHPLKHSRRATRVRLLLRVRPQTRTPTNHG